MQTEKIWDREIECPEAWWAAVDEWGEELVSLTPYNIHKPLGAGEACDSSPEFETIYEAFRRCKRVRDWQGCWLILQRTWASLPDHPGIHGCNGFNLLCTLCSETWVFEGDHPDAQ